jgi:serine/threonine protein kinase
MSRWYRVPEVILTCKNYGQPADIFSLGLVLVEMIYCTDLYYQDEGFNCSKRFLFPGKSCYPVSDNGEDSTSKDDQLIKIMQRLDLDPKSDFSFLLNEDEEDYCNQSHAFAMT